MNIRLFFIVGAIVLFVLVFLPLAICEGLIWILERIFRKKKDPARPIIMWDDFGVYDKTRAKLSKESLKIIEEKLK